MFCWGLSAWPMDAVPAEPRARCNCHRNEDAVCHQSKCHCSEQPVDGTGPAQHQRSATDGNDKPDETPNQRPEQPAGALRSKIKRKPQSKETESRTDDAQIGFSSFQHARLVTEQAQPGARP